MTADEFSSKMKRALYRDVPSKYAATIDVGFLLRSEAINWVVAVCAKVAAEELNEQDSKGIRGTRPEP